MRLNSVSVSRLAKNAPWSTCSYQDTKSRALPASVITSLSGGRGGPGGFMAACMTPGQPRSTPTGAPRM